MLYLKKKDFYFGSILSAIIGNKYKTVLIDSSSDDNRTYLFTSDTEKDFIAFLKASMSPTVRNKTTSWQFIFSDNEIAYIKHAICNEQNIKLFLLCGRKELRNSEIAILECDEICDSIFQNSVDKKSITVRKQTGFNNYYISRGGGRENDLKIPMNRIELQST